MKKFIIPISALILCICAQIVFPQVKTGKVAEKTSVTKDTAGTSATKDSTVKKKDAPKIFKSLRAPANIGNNAEGYLLTKDKIYKNDYRSAGDLFYLIPFGFQQDLGQGGQPHEVLLYGNGYGGITFNDDGIMMNNRLFNSFDLNNFQTEKIDSIEIYSLPKAFIFSNMNNNSAVNFISKDRVKEKQYSRARYYQGPNSEGYIDFIFNMPVFKKFFLTTQLTNNNIIDNYKNSNGGGWRASVKLRYLLSDKINLIANYNYVKTAVKLNGGVDLNQLKILYPAIWQQNLYNPRVAPVRIAEGEEKVGNHGISLRVLANLFENAKTDFTLYYQTGLTEFRLTEKDNTPSIVDDNKYFAYGFSFSHSLSFNKASLKFLVNKENSQMNADVLSGEKKNDLFSASAIGALNLIDSTFNPAFFIKNLTYNSNNYFGFGADLNISIGKNLFIYAGYSNYKKPYNLFEEAGLLNNSPLPSQNITNLETAIRYSDKNADIRLGYFHTENSNAVIPFIIKPDSIINNRVNYLNAALRKLDGINFSFSYKHWKVLAVGNSSLLVNYDATQVNNPGFTFDGGIFYVDTLFNSNLDLKAGFNFKYYSSQNFFSYDFEKYSSAQYISKSAGDAFLPIQKTADSYRIDFFMAARIQSSAILYFTWENLLNSQYFVVPYYPALGRSLRIGVSWEFLD